MSENKQQYIMDRNHTANDNNPLDELKEWKHKEEVARWKSLAISLYYEKKMLEKHLRDVYVELIKNKPRDLQCTCVGIMRVESRPGNKLEEAINYCTGQKAKERCSCIKKSKKNENAMNVEPVMEFPPDFKFVESSDDKWIDNFDEHQPKEVMKPSHNHNVKQRSQNVKDSKDVKKAYVPIPVSKNRSDEMKELYGSHKSQIAGVETALQLNFEHACSQLKTSYWPELQLNLG